jgi:hypothetical protein
MAEIFTAQPFDIIGNVGRVEAIQQARGREGRQVETLDLLKRRTERELAVAQQTALAEQEAKAKEARLGNIYKLLPFATEAHRAKLVNELSTELKVPLDVEKIQRDPKAFLDTQKKMEKFADENPKDLQGQRDLAQQFLEEYSLQEGASTEVGLLKGELSDLDKQILQQGRLDLAGRRGAEARLTKAAPGPTVTPPSKGFGDPFTMSINGKNISVQRNLDTGEITPVPGFGPEVKKKGFGQPFAATDKDGKSVLLQRNLDTGAIEPVKGFGPPLKAGQTISVDPDGTMTVTQGVPGASAAGLAKTTVSAIEKKRLSISRARVAMKLVKGQTKREFLTIAGIGRERLGHFAERWFGLRKDEKFREDFHLWKQKIEQAFQEYRHAITGAQASDKEIEHLRLAFPNVDDDATEFHAKMRSLVEFNEAMDAELNRISQEGFNFPKTEAEGRAITDEFLNRNVSGGDADEADALFNEYIGG